MDGIKEAKAKLQDELFILLANFEAKSGVHVTAILLHDSIDLQNPHIVDVEVRVEI